MLNVGKVVVSRTAGYQRAMHRNEALLHSDGVTNAERRLMRQTYCRSSRSKRKLLRFHKRMSRAVVLLPLTGVGRVGRRTSCSLENMGSDPVGLRHSCYCQEKTGQVR